MDNKILVIGGITLAAWALLGNQKPAAAAGGKAVAGGKSLITGEKAVTIPPVVDIPEVFNPATDTLPPWTDNPTPGEYTLQGELATATAASQNLAPILEQAYGPAWNLMVITPAEWGVKLAQGWTESQLKAAYTTSEAGRTTAIREYWIATHPGEAVPDILKDSSDKISVKELPPPVPLEVKTPEVVSPVIIPDVSFDQPSVADSPPPAWDYSYTIENQTIAAVIDYAVISGDSAALAAIANNSWY